MDDEDFVEENQFGSDGDESDGEESRHKQLLLAVSKSNKKNIRQNERSEASEVVSEFTLSRRREDEVDVNHLLAPLANTVALAKLRKAVANKRKKEKTLVKPLDKHTAQLIERKAGYGKVCREVGKWEPIVQQNRNAEQLHFPLEQPHIYMESMPEMLSNFKFSTPLELEMAALLGEKSQVVADVGVGKDDKGGEWTKVALDDAMELRNEMRKIRARQTYQEAKDRKRNKIKSKRYRRILKKERLKKEEQELMEMQRKNPQLVLDRLEELDRQRATERMSLKHRNTGKWAKYNLLRTKFNLDSGRAIQEQIELSRALTAKRLVPSDSEDEETPPAVKEDKEQVDKPNTDTNNPWFTISKSKTSQSGEAKQQENSQQSGSATVKGYRRYWENVNQKHAEKRKAESPEPEEEGLIDESDRRVRQPSDIEDVVSVKTTVPVKPQLVPVAEQQQMEQEQEQVVDPNNFITVEPKTVSFQQSGVGVEEEELDDVVKVDQRMMVAEAFADDDLVQQFRAEKQAVVESEKPQEVSLALPGWGEWGGVGLKMSERKRRRLTFRPEKVVARKDRGLAHVIMNEDGDKALRPHLLNKVPFPFRTKEEYEKSVRDPVGKHWNPETAFTRLIAPKVITKVGAIIKPIDQQALAKEKRKVKSAVKMTIQKTKLRYNIQN